MNNPAPEALRQRQSAGQPHDRGTFWLRAASLVAILFGLLTIREGGNVLFLGGTEGRTAGQFVPFIVWFNFIAGFAYVVAGYGLWLREPWAPRFALAIMGATLIAFAALGVHVMVGGGYEVRTVLAMIIRITAWAVISFIGYRFIGRGRKQIR